MKEDKKGCVDRVFRCIKDVWLEKYQGETKNCKDWKLIETIDWNDWKLIKHRAESPIQTNCKLINLCVFLLSVRLITTFN